MPSNHLVLCHPFSSCVQSYYSGLISFKIDWCDFQGTLKSLLQHRCGVASILWCSSFFMVQHSHPYMTAGKTVALTISVSQSSRSVMSDFMRPHESQHARPPSPLPTLGVYPNSGPSSWWYHPAISSSVVPFSSCPQSLPASESFPMSQLFAWGGQSSGVSALASFLPKKSQGKSPSEWTGWISLQSKGLSRVFSNTTVQKHQFFSTQPSSRSNSHIHTWLLEKP